MPHRDDGFPRAGVVRPVHHESIRDRFLRVFYEDTRQFSPAIHLAQGTTRLFPQFCFNRLRTELFRSAGLKIGHGSLLMGDLILSGDGDWREQFSIGEGSYITGPLRVNLGAPVRIGSRIDIGHDCLLVTVNHAIGGPDKRSGVSRTEPIIIEDGAWLASRVTVLPGITIGRGAVVAAGAVVTSDVAPDTLVGGVPARVIRKLAQPSDHGSEHGVEPLVRAAAARIASTPPRR
jgi:maltose O-acetyltransferase